MRSKEWLELTEKLRLRILSYCAANKIPIECHFAWLGDTSRFYSHNEPFDLDTVTYDTDFVEDIESFILEYIDILWEHCESTNDRIALYLEDIIKKDGWYDIIMGGAIFEDEV